MFELETSAPQVDPTAIKLAADVQSASGPVVSVTYRYVYIRADFQVKWGTNGNH